MAIPITRTKILLPRRRPDLLSRQRLLDSLVELLDDRLIIVAAPAGYGKTTLLIDLAHQTVIPFCWLALDNLDRDFTRFVSYLIAAINQRFPEFGAQSLQVLNSLNHSDPDIDPLITTFVNEACDTIHEHFAVVLDDYHYVDSQEDINGFLGRLIQEMDENCHFIVSSRTLISLPDLPLMVARSQVGGLGFDELAFRSAEVRALVMQNYRIALSETDAENIAKESEGWITGLLLSAQSSWQGRSDLSRLAKVSQIGLYDYLAQQVLNQQPPPVREFLLHTSLLEEFNADLCESVLGSPPNGSSSWSSLMDTVLRDNLFVLPVDDRGLWLRYHHLFRDFLQSQLHKENPQTEKRISHQLAHVYAQRGEWERAYHLYQKLGQTDDLINLIERVGSQLQQAGRITTLAAWIDALPPEVLANRPALLSLRGSVAVMLGEVERGLLLLNHAVELYQVQDNPAGLALTISRRSYTQRFLGKIQDALHDADEAIRLIGSSPTMDLQSVKAEAIRSRGMCLARLGKPGEAIECLKEAAGIFDALGYFEVLALTQIDLGMIFRSLGEYHQAGAAYEQALAHLKRTNNITKQSTVYNNLGVLYQDLGEFERAGQALECSLELARSSGYIRTQALALSSIGDLYLLLDGPEAASKAYSQAYEVNRRLNDRFLRFYLFIRQAACARLTGKISQAVSQIEEAFSLFGDNPSPFDRGLWHLENGLLCQQQTDTMDAIDSFQKAQDAFSISHHRIEQIQALLYLANLLSLTSDLKGATIHLERALNLLGHLENTRAITPLIRDLAGLSACIPSLSDENASQLKGLLADTQRLQVDLPALRRKLRRQVSVIPFAAPRLTIKALGRAMVQVDGKTITNLEWQSQSARDLLFFILAHPEGLTKDDIAETFWPEAEISAAKLLFKNTLYRLRRVLDQEFIILSDDHYFFNRSLDYEYDVEIIQQLIDQANKQSPAERQISSLRTLVNTYKGPFLPDTTGSWAVPIRQQLERVYYKSATQLVELLIQSGDHHSALEHCQELLAKDPSIEEAHRLAMRIYAALGSRADVVRQYERCEQTLLRELNLPPSPQTRILYESLTR